MPIRSLLKFSTALSVLAMACPMPVAQAQQVENTTEMEELVVTGTYLRRKSQSGSPIPITVVGKEDLQQLGAVDIADLVNTLPTNNGAENFNDPFSQNLSRGTENINLRGLGVSSTLVLLNNKRQVSSAATTNGGINFVDTASLVPLIAIEQVEILEGGASAIYGTDAVAGVVNFITRRDFEGLELRAEFQTNAGGPTQSDYVVQGIWGGQTERARMIVAASYLDRTALTSREHNLRPDAFVGFGGLSAATLTSQPGDVILSNFLPGSTPNLAQLEFAGQMAPQYLPFALTDPATGAPIVDPGTGLPFTTFDPVTLQPVAPGTPGGVLLAGGAVGDPTVAAINAAGLPGNDGAPVTFEDPNCLAAAAFEDDLDTSMAETVGLANGSSVLAGQCTYDFGTFFSVVPNETRIQAFSQFEYDITDELQFFGEFSFARNRAVSQSSNFPITVPIFILGPFTNQIDESARNPVTGLLPAVNPFNPTGQDLIFTGRTPGRGQVEDFYTDFPHPNDIAHNTYRVNAGFRGQISETWRYEVSYLHAVNDFDFIASDGLATQHNLALIGLGGTDCNPLTGVPGVGGCFFYNPFASGSLADPSERAPVFQADGSPVIDPATGEQLLAPVRNSEEVIDFVSGQIMINATSRLEVVDAVVGGEVFDLPGGPIFVEAGFQFRAEDLSQDQDDDTNSANFLFVTAPLPDYAASRNSYAGFFKIDMPLLDGLNLEAAVRYENIDLAGDTVDPTIAINYRPFDWISLRGSWGTSFRAPSLFQVFGNQTSLTGVSDPARGGQVSFLAVGTSGNLNLSPEESTAYNAGITLTPGGALTGLEFSVDYFRFEFDDIILQESPEAVVLRALTINPDTGVVPGLVDRNVFGELSLIRTEYLNTSFLDTDGIDFAASYTLDTKFGLFRAGIQGTYVASYEAPIGLDNARVDLSDRRNALNFFAPVPDLRYNINLNYVKGNHSAVAFVRYVNSFIDDQNCDGGPTPADFTGPELIGTAGFTQCPEGSDPFVIDSHVTVDAQYSYQIPGFAFVEEASLTVGAINLFDNLPPFVNTDGAFESQTHDPRGRQIYVRLQAKF